MADTLQEKILQALEKNDTDPAMQFELILLALSGLLERVDVNSRELLEVKKFYAEFRPWGQAIRWGAGLLGGLLIVLLWGIFTGVVAVVFS